MAVELDDLKIKPEPAKMSLIGRLPGESAPTTQGQDIAIGAAKALLPDLTDPKEAGEYFVDLLGHAKAQGPAKGALTFAGKRLIKEIPAVKRGLDTLGDYGQSALNRLKMQPAYATAGGTPNLKIGSSVDNAAQPLMIKGTNTLPQTRPELRKQAKKLHVEEGMDIKDVRKSILGDEQFWTDLETGEKYAIHSAKGKGITLVGQSSRGQRGAKRILMTEQQSLASGEQVFAKYNSKGNIVDLLVKEGDEIHHWNSLIDKAPAYKGLNTQQAKEFTSMAREAGWFLGDHKNNLLKMTRGDHKAIHAWMRQNGIEGAKAGKIMEKMYEGKSVKERFKIFRGFMEYVQGGVDEQLVKMGYSMPEMHKLAQEANRKLIKLNK